jgi:hypothetical protein
LDSGTYLPVAVGALIAAVGSLTFVGRSMRRQKSNLTAGQQRGAMKSVVAVYAIIAWVCLFAALALGDRGFVVTTGLIALIATLGLFVVWRGKSPTS